MNSTRRQKSYDHGLLQLVQQTGDATIATRIGVPRSTAKGWVRRAPHPVATTAVADAVLAKLRARVSRLKRRNELLRSVLRILFALLKALKPDLSRLRIPAPDKARLLRAIERTRGVIGLHRVLGIVGLSPFRLRWWRQAEQKCRLDDESSCPKASPTRLTAAEVAALREMVTSPDLSRVSTGTSPSSPSARAPSSRPPRRGVPSCGSADGAVPGRASILHQLDSRAGPVPRRVLRRRAQLEAPALRVRRPGAMRSAGSP